MQSQTHGIHSKRELTDHRSGATGGDGPREPIMFPIAAPCRRRGTGRVLIPSVCPYPNKNIS